MQFAAFMLAISAFVACASPGATFDRFATSNQLNKIVVQGDGFLHAIYRRSTALDSSLPLHIYLGGDGLPWIGNRPADDPTPRNPLSLRLLALDPDQSVYVGRPCYHGLSDTPECQAKYWTSARYSPAVIGSVVSVINQLIESEGVEEVVLFGFSGGGTIAVLAARDIKATTSVVTVAANLDTDAWSLHHRYDPLVESLNPSLQSPLDSSILQIHLVAENDQKVPPATSQNFFDSNVGASRVSYSGFDHQCCWENIWPDFLSSLPQQR